MVIALRRFDVEQQGLPSPIRWERARVRVDAHFSPKDRLNPRLPCRLHELNCPVQVARVGERDSGQAVMPGQFDNGHRGERGIEKGVVTVHVEWDVSGRRKAAGAKRKARGGRRGALTAYRLAPSAYRFPPRLPPCAYRFAPSQNEIVSAQQHSPPKFLAQLIHHTRQPLLRLPLPGKDIQSQRQLLPGGRRSEVGGLRPSDLRPPPSDLRPGSVVH